MAWSRAMLRSGSFHENGDTLRWPELRIAGPRRYELLAEYSMEWQVSGFPRQRLVVPQGFECDGASVPALLEWYLGREKILPAAVPHDWQYAFAGRIPAGSHLYLADDGEWKRADHLWTRDESDRFFARNLKFCEIRNDQRRNAYRAVRIGGWIAWRRAERRQPLSGEDRP
jgi:hypothetical protein